MRDYVYPVRPLLSLRYDRAICYSKPYVCTVDVIYTTIMFGTVVFVPSYDHKQKYCISLDTSSYQEFVASIRDIERLIRI